MPRPSRHQTYAKLIDAQLAELRARRHTLDVQISTLEGTLELVGGPPPPKKKRERTQKKADDTPATPLLDQDKSVLSRP